MGFFKDKIAVISASFLMLTVLFILLVPLLFPYGPNDVDWDSINMSPCLLHPFGTDGFGRDIMARVAVGLRLSLAIGLLASAVSIIIGVAWGSVAGYTGGRTDYLMMRFVDIMYSLPFMFFVIILIVFLGRNIFNLFIALGAVQWLTMSRIVRSQVMSLKKSEFVEAARSIGVKKYRIIFKHIVPNILGVIISYGFLLIPVVIMEESFLSFLGLGVQPPNASLGVLINDGVAVLDVYWWMLFIPATFLVLTLICLNFMGEALKKSFSPRYDRI